VTHLDRPSPYMALQRTRRRRVRSSRSLLLCPGFGGPVRSFGSPLNARPLGGAASLALALTIILINPSCASIGEPAAWADGEVRDSGKPIQGALVFIGNLGGQVDPT
jgi:hypothetical protein